MMALAHTEGTHRRAGANAESHILQRTPELGSVPDPVAPWFDAVAVDPLREDDFIDVRIPLERGDRVEIKSAIVRLASGQRGRFNFRRKQHERLQDADGRYLLLVCEPKPARDVLAAVLVDADALDASEAGWVEIDVDDRDETAFKQIGWSVLVDVDAVPGETHGVPQ